MVCGGIGSCGYRTQLIKFTENVNKVTYQEALKKKKNGKYNKYIWQPMDAATEPGDATFCL